MNAQTNLPAQRQATPLDHLKAQVTKRADDFRMVLPAHISVEKFQRTIATAALSSPKLLECDRQSMLIAAMRLAQDGLLPDGREAALVPFKTRVKDGNQWLDKWLVQAMPMSWGLRKKVLQSGEVISLQVGVVYAAEVEAGNFIYEIGIEPPIRHRPKLDMTEAEMADDQMVAAYSIARIKAPGDTDPYWSVEIMRRAEVLKVRQMSQTGALGKTDRQGKAIPPKGPWVDWQPEMWKKTVLRRHTKVLPSSGDLLDAIERDMDEERAAESAARMLETETRPPVTLDDVGDGETVDAETGEITDNRGMSEVDEETARALDAQTGDQGFEQGRVDEEHGDQHDGAANMAYADEAWGATYRELMAGFAAAQTPREMKALDKRFTQHRVAFPEEPLRDLDQASTSARKRVGRDG